MTVSCWKARQAERGAKPIGNKFQRLCQIAEACNGRARRSCM